MAAITLNDLTVNFRHLDPMALLDDWRWLIGERKRAVLVTALGDAFVQDPDDGSIHLLSAAQATLQRIASNGDEFQSLLRDPAFVTERFVPAVVSRLRNEARHLRSGQLYGFKVPPHLGGEYSPSNLEPTDIAVHFSLLGQLHRKARGVTPGAPVRGVKID